VGRLCRYRRTVRRAVKAASEQDARTRAARAKKATRSPNPPPPKTKLSGPARDARITSIVMSSMDPAPALKKLGGWTVDNCFFKNSSHLDWLDDAPSWMRNTRKPCELCGFRGKV